MRRQFSVLLDRHRYAREWQARTGGKVIGGFCGYVPEEILYAAGALPVRVLGAHELQDITDQHISAGFCSYTRDVLAQGLLGKYDYLDGMILSHVCPQIRQSFESWRIHRPTEFSYLLHVPSQVQSPSALLFFSEQLNDLRRSVESWLGKPVSDDELHRAIAVYDQNRCLLRALYELRKERPPRFSGADAMAAVLAGTMMDKLEHNLLLEGLLAGPSRLTKEGVRVMVVGSENDQLDLTELIESVGADVVIEDHCLGSRYFWNVTSPGPDPISAIARRYLQKVPCPLLDVNHPRQRGRHLLELAREYGVAGVIFLRQKFCDAHGYEQPIVQSLLEEEGLPSLSLELDFTVPLGQYQTRIEAFTELYL